MDYTDGMQRSEMMERYMRLSDERRNCIYCHGSSNFLQGDWQKTWEIFFHELQKHKALKSYLCTLGYFISEMTLVASVWLCFRSGGHMLSTQSTWSTCDQTCTFSHQSQSWFVTFNNHNSRECYGIFTTVGRLMRFSSLVWLNSKLMTLKSLSRSSSGVS